MAVQLLSGELKAIFDPEKGMNLLSYSKGGLEVIDPATDSLFRERFAGKGALIGPHFHQRPKARVKPISNPSAFPHLKFMEGRPDPFSHGIARYVPWKFEADQTSIRAKLSGKDLYQEMKLADIEGQNFELDFRATLTDRLHIEYSVVSDTDSVVGLHTYYRLVNGKGVVRSKVKEEPFDLALELDKPYDLNFHPFRPREGSIALETIDYSLAIEYKAPSEEISWQLFHPQGATFVCLEPISAYNPRSPHLTSSSIEVNIEIFKN